MKSYPYARESEAVTAVIPPNDTTWHSQIIPLTTANIATKIEAIAAYTSQISTFFNGRVDLEKQIYDHATHSGGERLWQHKTNLASA
ncbi:MAG: hypothetical protein HC804_08945 [Anaerolineae bacterium]|nr:hypothetical protein [Anaerolineae bacterium]